MLLLREYLALKDRGLSQSLIFDILAQKNFPKGYVEPGGKDKYVYFILDPRKPRFEKKEISLPFEPFYVGKGTNKRFASRKNDLVNERIDNLISLGLEPKFTLIPYPDDNSAFIAEESFIKIIGRKLSGDGPLLNIDAGGIRSPKKFRKPRRAYSIEEQKQNNLRVSRGVEKTWGMLWKLTLSSGEEIFTSNLSKWVRENKPNLDFEYLRKFANLKITPYGIKVEKLQQNQERLEKNKQ